MNIHRLSRYTVLSLVAIERVVGLVVRQGKFEVEFSILFLKKLRYTYKKKVSNRSETYDEYARLEIPWHLLHPRINNGLHCGQ